MPILKTFSIFAKFWEKGKVKTRLGQAIGVGEAANLYHQFLRVSVQMASSWSGRRIIGFSPEDKAKEFRELAPEWELVPQVTVHSGKTADLGVRMKCFFDAVFQSPKSQNSEEDHRVVLIGSDTPLLTIQMVETAFDLLAQNDVVIGPSSDGGYYLIGARNQTPDIFDQIQWSSNQVLDQTIEQLDAKQYQYRLLDVHDDVDDINDLRRLAQELVRREKRNDDLETLLNHSQAALAKSSSEQHSSLVSNDSPNLVERDQP